MNRPYLRCLVHKLVSFLLLKLEFIAKNKSVWIFLGHG